MTIPQQHKQVVVFDMPRTRSHLFSRYITTHPDLEHYAHPFVAAACFGPERLGLHMTLGAEDDSTAKNVVPVSDDDTYEGAAAAFVKAQHEAIRKVSRHLQLVNMNMSDQLIDQMSNREKS